ncbi:MAG: nitroreductase family protein [Candidatus Thermoplasmatota archaeon]|nr:nitroreductase family protein [Candidatus Thermoplasmatota archaeon]MBS3789549.1 nitroreductase family protein [Candidatus Thermoplasmatota archaeon]
MDVYEAIKNRRSIRRYKDEEVPKSVLKKCVNAARLSPSGANKQPLKFITVTEKLETVFEHTNWAGYLDWDPTEEEMPRAYIAIIKKIDTGLKTDAGIAANNICLTALNEGIGSCILGAIDKEELEEILPVPNNYELELMVALGYPAEDPQVIESEEKVEYYHKNGQLHVPKRPLDKVWIER